MHIGATYWSRLEVPPFVILMLHKSSSTKLMKKSEETIMIDWLWIMKLQPIPNPTSNPLDLELTLKIELRSHRIIKF